MDKLLERASIDYTSWSWLSLIGQLMEWTPKGPVRDITSAANINPLDGFIRVSGTTTVTLETAVGADGRVHYIKNVGSDVVTIACTGSETIDGEATLELPLQYDAVFVRSNGVNWELFGSHGDSFGGGGSGGGGVTSARVAADGTAIYEGPNIASTERTAEGVYLAHLTTAVDVVDDEPQMAAVATPSTVVGNGGDGVSPLKAYSSFQQVLTGQEASGAQFFHQDSSNDIFLYDSVTDLIYRHDLDSFTTAATTMGVNGKLIRSGSTAGVMDYEQEYLWVSGDHGGAGTSVRAVEIATGTVTDFGSTEDRIVLGARGGRIITRTGGTMHIFEPNFGTSSLGSALYAISEDMLGTDSGDGCWDAAGHLWLAGPVDTGLYEVDLTTGDYVLHDYPDVNHNLGSCAPVYDFLRNRIYAGITKNGDPTYSAIFEYFGWASLIASSGQYRQITPNGHVQPSALYHDLTSDVVAVNDANDWIFRYYPGDWIRIDAVLLSDINFDHEPSKIYYADDAAYVVGQLGSDNQRYLLKLIYDGAQLSAGTGGSFVSSVLTALTRIVDSDTVEIQLFRSTNPPVRADGEFSVHIAYDGAGSSESSSGSAGAYGEVQLTLSGANLSLGAYKGNKLSWPDGTVATLSSAVTLAATGLSVGTLYYIYATQSANVVNALEASTTATATTNGVRHKSGDSSRVFVGLGYTITGPAWRDHLTQRYVRSYFNDPGYQLWGAGAGATSSSGTYVEFSSPSRIEFVALPNEVVDFGWQGVGYPSTGGSVALFALGYDGSVINNGGTNLEAWVADSVATQYHGFSLHDSFKFTEGHHYISGYLKVSGSGNAVIHQSWLRATLRGLP